jgi:DNA-binding PadR family transcriptional regulator
MRRTVSKRGAAQASRELDSLMVSFSKLRILYYAAEEAVTRTALLHRLRKRRCGLSPTRLNRILGSMVRRGWLKTEVTSARDSQGERAYTLTASGHRVLKIAQSGLRQLVATWVPRDSKAHHALGNGCEAT